MQIFRIDENDYDAVLALNAESVPHVSVIGHDELQWFADNAACVSVAKIEDRNLP